MATNPMQRQKKVSFLSGMVITLIITGAIIALLVMQLTEIKKKEKAAQARLTPVQILNTDVKSGQLLTADMFQEKKVDSNTVPSDAIVTAEDLNNYNLQTVNGEDIICKKDDNNENRYFIKDNDGNEIEIENKDNGYVRKDNNEKVELNKIPLVAKIDMLSNTVLTGSVLSKTDELVTEDVREMEYNMFTLQSDIKDEDVIDVRIKFPNGTDYIVVSKKSVKIPTQSGLMDGDTIKIKLSEDEILAMSCAIYEAYSSKGAELIVAKYVEPGLQGAAIPTYPVKDEVMKIIENDPNVTKRAMEEIKRRYENNSGAIINERNERINAVINKEDEETRKTNIESNVQENVTKSKELRKKFLEQAANEAAATTDTAATDTATATE